MSIEQFLGECPVHFMWRYQWVDLATFEFVKYNVTIRVLCPLPLKLYKDFYLILLVFTKFWHFLKIFLITVISTSKLKCKNYIECRVVKFGVVCFISSSSIFQFELNSSLSLSYERLGTIIYCFQSLGLNSAFSIQTWALILLFRFKNWFCSYLFS